MGSHGRMRGRRLYSWPSRDSHAPRSGDEDQDQEREQTAAHSLTFPDVPTVRLAARSWATRLSDREGAPGDRLLMP
jgi:hypothetical protein